MAEKPWAEQAIDQFFVARKSPTRTQCDKLALLITNGSAVHSVPVPGSLSYTVVCTKTQGQEQQDGEAIVVSFRESESGLDEGIAELARMVHGCLVPQSVSHGIANGSDPPIAIYTMPLLPGVTCLEALSYQADMDSDEEAKHICFITHLARYFARCWSAPQPMESRIRAEHQALISQRLARLMASPSVIVPISMLSELQTVLPLLFSSEYPQVLTHGDFSKTNVLVNPNTYEVTGIVDWSLATVQPFGIDLDCLYLMTGCMNLTGWHYFTCRPRLLETFWAEFWTSSGIMNNSGVNRENVRAMVDAAAKIGAVLRYAFDRNANGSPSEELSTSNDMSRMLKAWFVD
ncbi:hypothetical protein BN1723_014248 [Verticillium longisporum]|uniref:Aminoglycoside phosphotransferase domain-containing protein n=1 Tax=Verticillium longisporum TaxID=100787 RepID=A0A0G4M5C9_VERLO|nr:hypothetical protein BN1723_014248 [Verticillium longisporum]